MKKFLLLILCSLITLLSLCQTGIVNNGAKITLTNGSFITVSGAQGNIYNKNNGLTTGQFENNGVVEINGNWTNDGRVLPASGTIILTGNNSTINGSVVSVLKNLYINKPNGTDRVILNSDLEITGGLYMYSGDMYLNNRNINLGSTGNIFNETNSNKIYDDYTNGTGTITASRANLTPAAGENFGNIGVVVTSGQYFGNTVITRGHKFQTSVTTSGSSIGRYFDVSTESTDDLFATMNFIYLDDEIPSGMNEADFSLYKSVDNGLNWTNQAGTVSEATNTIEQTGIKQFCRYTVSDKYISPLPIDLLDFSAARNNSVVNLDWKTRVETNNMGFDIERSTDLYSWEKIGFVDGSGNSNSLLYYSYNDMLEGINADVRFIYYRLKQIDFDGIYKHTEVRAVELENETSEITMSLYPNPANDFVNIVSNSPETEWTVQIFNMRGELIKSLILVNSSLVEVSDIPQGIYQIAISSKEKGVEFIKKLVVI